MGAGLATGGGKGGAAVAQGRRFWGKVAAGPLKKTANYLAAGGIELDCGAACRPTEDIRV